MSINANFIIASTSLHQRVIHTIFIIMSETPKTIKLLLIDDHPIVRAGISQILQQEPDLEMVCATDNGFDGIEAADNFATDVVLLDLQLPDIGGLEVAQRLLRQKPHLKILIITSMTNYLYPSRLFAAGVNGYLLKTDPIEEWANAIRLVFSGEHYISPGITKYIVPSPRHAASDAIFNKLSDRELQVIMLRVQGFSNEAIGKRMNLGMSTIHTYRSRIFDKLKITNDIELMLLALEHGLVELQQTKKD